MSANNAPFNAKFAVNFQYVSPRWTIDSVEVFQETASHQRVIVTLTYPVKDVLPAAGTPVSLEYGQAVYDWETYVGYVNHIEYLAGNKAEIWTIGTSAPMRSGSVRAWENVTASYIARTLATKYNLESVVDTNSEVFTVVQTGQSDFSFLNDIADRVGFKLYIVGTTLYFVNPLVSLRDTNNFTKWFWMTTSIFTPKVGELIPGANNITDKTAYSFDAESGNLLTARGQYSEYLAFGESQSFNPMIKEYKTDTSGLSLQELTSRLNAEVSGNMHWVTAAAALNQGSVRVHPGDAIGLQGQIADKFQGLWLVYSIKQTLTPRDTNNWTYRADVALMRDQIYGLSINTRVTNKNIVPSSPKWLNGAWISENVSG